jgi:DNA-binding NarL/FixJ family response regulator
MYSASEFIIRALQAGARGYLLKESAGVAVADAVRAVHAGRRYLSQRIADDVVDSFARQRQVDDSADSLARLSARELEVLQLVVEGRSTAEIAGILFLSPKTVNTYRSRLMSKLGIEDLASLVKFAIQHGLTPLE